MGLGWAYGIWDGIWAYGRMGVWAYGRMGYGLGYGIGMGVWDWGGDGVGVGWDWVLGDGIWAASILPSTFPFFISILRTWIFFISEKSIRHTLSVTCAPHLMPVKTFNAGRFVTFFSGYAGVVTFNVLRPN
jgi:hypothetical protein